MWKFNKNGNYINRWSRQGHGPGEITNPRSFYILNDTINVVDSPKIKKFDINGNFISDINVVNYSDFPSNIFASCERYLIGKKVGFDVDTKMKTDKIMMYDHKELRVIKTLFERKYKKKGSMFSRDDYFLYTGDEKEFFIVNNSYDEYKIDCFDSKSGKLKYKIRKNHIRVKNEEEEKTHRGVYEGKEIIVTTGGEKLKESINWIFYDKYGRLWVDSNNIHEEEPGLHFDIFKDGVFLNRIKLDLPLENPWGFNLNRNKILIRDDESDVHIYEFE